MVVCSRSPQNLELGCFTLLFCRGRQRNVPKFKQHVQSDLFLLFCGAVVAVVVVFFLTSLSLFYKEDSFWGMVNIVCNNRRGKGDIFGSAGRDFLCM